MQRLKKFWMPWRMTQKRISKIYPWQSTILEKVVGEGGIPASTLPLPFFRGPGCRKVASQLGGNLHKVLRRSLPFKFKMREPNLILKIIVLRATFTLQFFKMLQQILIFLD